MKERSAFQVVSDAVKKTGVPCVLIGGFAVNFYKYSRQTSDIDFLITEEDFETLLSLLEEAGYKKKHSQDTFIRLTSDKLYLLGIDFLFVDKVTLDKIIKDGKKIAIAKYKFIIPSLWNLIALKLHFLKSDFQERKAKDIIDIVSLAKINNLDLEGVKFKELCDKYGNSQIRKKILEIF